MNLTEQNSALTDIRLHNRLVNHANHTNQGQIRVQLKGRFSIQLRNRLYWHIKNQLYFKLK